MTSLRGLADWVLEREVCEWSVTEWLEEVKVRLDATTVTVALSGIAATLLVYWIWYDISWEGILDNLEHAVNIKHPFLTEE
jgi:hypothetical protein